MAGGGPIGGGGDWLRGGLGTAIANATNMLAGPGQQIMGQYGNPLAQLSQQNLGNTTDAMNYYLGGQNGVGGLLNNFGNYGNQITNMGGQYIDQNTNNGLMGGAQGALGGVGGAMNPALQGAAGGFSGGIPGLSNTGNLAGQVFAGGGWTPQYQQGFDQISNIFNGGGAGNPGGATQFQANNLIKNGGQTAANMDATKLSNNVMSSGGFNPYIQMGKDPTQNILNRQGASSQSDALSSGGQNTLTGMYGVGGLTPTGATSEAAGLQGILQGGTTPYTTGLQNRGLNLVNQQALMSPSEAASLASNQAGTVATQNFKQAAEQAARAGGGPGDVTSGIGNEFRTDFADKIAQSQSDAVSKALNNQQQLQLQQQGQGTQMLTGGGGLEAQMLNAYGGIQGGNESTAAGRFGTGANMLGQSGQLQNNMMLGGLGNANSMSNAASNYLSPYGQYGASAMGNQAQMLGQGGNLAQILQSGQQGALQNMTGMMGNQNNYALGMGGLQNNISQGLGGLTSQLGNTQGNIYNNLFGTGIQQGQLGLGQFQGMTGAYNQGMGQQLGLGQLMNQQQGTWMNPLQAYGMNVGPDMLKTGVTGPGSWLSGGAGGGANPITSGAFEVLSSAASGAGKAAAGSSIKFKEDVEELTEEDTKALMNLRPVKFKYIGDPVKEIHYGLIAEELEKDYPEAVKYDEDGEIWGVFYQKINGLLLKKVQELETRLSKLEGK